MNYRNRGKFLFRTVLIVLLWSFVLSNPADEVYGWSGLSFLEEPSDVVVRRSSPGWLHCVVKGSPKPTITWRKEGSPLHLIRDPDRVLLPNGTLFISSVGNRRADSSDAGLYQCEASLPGVGKIVSTRATLSVAGLPKFDDQPVDREIFERERARFACAIAGNPPPRIVWYRDGLQLVLDSRMTLLPSGSLEIENARLSDQGEYYCHATSLDKAKVSRKAKLLVKEAFALRQSSAPYFITKPSSMVIIIKQNVTLDCAANGYPEPSIIWLKDGATIDMQNLDSRFFFLGTTRTLLITEVKEEDAGTYMCRAENEVDSVDAISHIQIEVSPVFVEKPQNKISYQKEDLEFACRVYGQPKPKVLWLKDGEHIPDESSYFQIVGSTNLKILGVVKGDAGIYQCFASNSAGEIQASAQLIVLEAGLRLSPTHHSKMSSSNSSEHYTPTSSKATNRVPSAPRHLQKLIISNRYITLSWHKPETNNDNIVGYSVFYYQEGSHRERVQNISSSPSIDHFEMYKTQIGQLNPGSAYLVRVVALTPDGLYGHSTEEIRISTSPDLDLPDPPSDLSVIPMSPNSLFISWKAPKHKKTPVSGYNMYYMELGSAKEHELELEVTQHQLTDLDEYTEYSIWVSAVNAHGIGDPTHEITARTFSAPPTREPLNISSEAASARSLIIRWEPPPPKDQNGIITGYKIRYKKRGSPGSTTKTTDGNRRLYVLSDLEKKTTYVIKLSAMTINGSGPASHWIQAETFANDLDENRVPDKPLSLRALPNRNSIEVLWYPPDSQEVMIRGYRIGWGKGFPDVYLEILESHAHSFNIDGLDPNSEYVISLRAFNNVGDGAPIYDQVRTRSHKQQPQATLTPPVGLKTEVLTSYTISLSWTDTTLNRNQYIGDRGHYTVRYTTYASSNPRYKYINVSDVTCLIDSLKPSTMYEFSVKATKGRRESPWSLVVMNTTLVAKPSSPPRDVTVVTMMNDPTTVLFNWQPPKQANGRISGYLIFYSTYNESDLALEEVLENKMTFTLKGLTPSTLYYYKMQARNDKGFGPFSPLANFTTLVGVSHIVAAAPATVIPRDGFIMLVIGGVIGVATFVAAVVALAIYCRRGKTRVNAGNGTLTKNKKVEVKPPDLWIHHDHLELKNLNKTERSISPSHTTIINHTGAEFDPDDKRTPYTSTSTLDRRTPYQSYLRDQLSDDETDKLLNRRSFKPKPLIVSLDVNRDPVIGGSTSSSVYSDGTMGRPGYALPHYPMTTSQGYNSPQENPYSPNPTSGMNSMMGVSLPPYDTMNPLSQPSQPHMGGLITPTSSGGNYNSLGSSDGSSTLGKRLGNPLRSFSVPGPPQSAPTTPQPKHIVAVHSLGGSTSPFKKALNIPPTSSLPNNIPLSARRVLPVARVDALPEQEEIGEGLMHGYSTEELTQEMANLEGLMKDLSAITANQFNC